jgi:hypothetical protein
MGLVCAPSRGSSCRATPGGRARCGRERLGPVADLHDDLIGDEAVLGLERGRAQHLGAVGVAAGDDAGRAVIGDSL